MSHKTASYNQRTKQFTLFEDNKISGICKEMTYNQKTNQFQRRDATGRIIGCYLAKNQVVTGNDGRILIKQKGVIKANKKGKKTSTEPKKKKTKK